MYVSHMKREVEGCRQCKLQAGHGPIDSLKAISRQWRRESCRGPGGCRHHRGDQPKWVLLGQHCWLGRGSMCH